VRFDPALLRLSSYPHVRRLSLIYADLDVAGHVNNVAYARFFEEGRMFFWNRVNADLVEAPPEAGRLAHVEIDYLAEMNYPADISVGIGILDVGRTSFRLGEAVFRGEECTAIATAVDVVVDRETGRPVPISDSHRAMLDRHRIGPSGS
jgi:acyl-CoA thioester hydrolase